MAYIHYDQKPNGTIYASVYESYRDKGKVKTRRIENLGRVVDKQNGLFVQCELPEICNTQAMISKKISNSC